MQSAKDSLHGRRVIVLHEAGLDAGVFKFARMMYLKEETARVAMDRGLNEDDAGEVGRNEIHEFSRCSVIFGDHFLNARADVVGIVRVGNGVGECQSLRGIDEAHLEGDLFDAGNLQPLSLLDRLNEVRCLQQRLMCPGVEPRSTAAEKLDMGVRRVRDTCGSGR